MPQTHPLLPHIKSKTPLLPSPASSNAKLYAEPCTLNLHEDQLIEQDITWAEDARTASAKADTKSPHCVAIDRAHSSSKTYYPNPILWKSTNSCLALTTSLRQA